MRKLLGTSVAILSLAVLPGLAEAVPITGTLSLTGAEVTIDATTIDWAPDGTGSGTIPVSSGTGYFGAGGPYGSLVGSLDTLQDLDLASTPPGPAGNTDPLAGFQTVAGTGLDFTLTTIDPCGVVGPQCLAGPGSPFFFQEFGGSTTVILAMHGTVIDTNNPGFLSTWTGTFSADFAGMTAAQILDQLDAQGFITAPYSAQKIAVDVPNVIPEPASMILLGSGLVGLAARARRRSKKA